MTRTESDLRNAFLELSRQAGEQDAPSLESILHGVRTQRPVGLQRGPAARWLAPIAVAAAVALAAGITTLALRSDDNGTSPQRLPAAAAPIAPASTRPVARADQTAGGILNDAAAELSAEPAWTAPQPQQFFYVQTTQASTWTSVSGTRAGRGRTSDGRVVFVPGCDGGQIVSTGQSGACTLSDVPHYLSDAPTTPSQWDAYLERMAPGSRADNAQGKIIVQVLHQDLIAPKAAAALLRYTARCPGLHAIAVKPVGGKNLVGVTCTSMTNGSYGLVFDARSHAFLGFVGVSSSGQQNWPAEIIQKTALVAALGQG